MRFMPPPNRTQALRYWPLASGTLRSVCSGATPFGDGKNCCSGLQLGRLHLNNQPILH